ncbi:hypothetical protein HYT57_03450 [Candidatus Woesearchaeota archaeon]|nr:hypothetical protein [Candidatus Woesearchaeota archaeon]
MGKILARYVHTEPIPGKLFLFDSGVEAFGETLDLQVQNAEEYARGQLSHLVYPHEFVQWKAIFTLGLIWGDSASKVIDLYGYKGIDQSSSDYWKNANPDVTMWVAKTSPGFNGAAWKKEDMASCETSLIILGREAVHRRKTSGLEEYMRSHAYLMDMEPCEQYRVLKI